MPGPFDTHKDDWQAMALWLMVREVAARHYREYCNSDAYRRDRDQIKRPA